MKQVMVIGGGPGGALAAILLARAGLSVTLAEATRFPRPKVCGECLSALGIEVLSRHALSPLIESAHPTRLTHVLLASHETTSSHLLPRPMWGISRNALDQLLLSEAERIGVTLLQPARVEQIQERPDAVSITLRHGSDLLTREFPLVIVAAGKPLHIDSPPPATPDLGIKGHFRNVSAPPHTIVLYNLPNSYGGLAPIEAELWNVAFSLPADQAKAARGDLQAVWQSALSASPYLRRVMRGAEQVGDFLASPLPRYPVHRHFSPRIIPLGNAAAALEPIGGEGMGLALRSAELAAESILAAAPYDRLPDIHHLRRRYARLWQTRRLVCRTVALTMSRPPLARLIPTAAKRLSPAAHAVMRAMGK